MKRTICVQLLSPIRAVRKDCSRAIVVAPGSTLTVRRNSDKSNFEVTLGCERYNIDRRELQLLSRKL
jgi:hypothetical protein